MSEPAAKTRSVAARILINAMSGAGNRIATMAIGFLLTPYIIHELGFSLYGVWSIVGSLAGYLGFLDFGLGGAFVKFMSEFVERDDKRSARQVVVFGMVFYTAFGIVLAGPILYFAPALVHAFKMPVAQYAAAADVFRITFVLLVLFMIFNVPGMVVVSMQRMDLASRNGFVSYLGYAAATVLFLKLHFGVLALVGAQAVQLVIVSALQIVTARRLFGPLWHNPLRIEGAIVRRMFAFGGWTQANAILGAVNLDIGRFIAAGVVSVASVGLYEIASKLAFFSKLFPAYLLDALMPAAAAADARSDGAQLERMYAVGTRLSVFLTFACAGFVIGGADAMVRVWLGASYPNIAAIVFWLALGYVANSLTGVGTTILRASGKPHFETYYTAMTTLANVASTVVLVRPYGIVGVAMGTTVGWFAGTLYFLLSYHSTTHVPWWKTIGSPLARVVLASVLATAAFFAFVHLSSVARTFEHRALGLLVLLTASACYFALFTGLSIVFGVWAHDGPAIVLRLRELRARASRSVFRLQRGGA
jgi:O-antigen/teichoic acid export membrane protein